MTRAASPVFGILLVLDLILWARILPFPDDSARIFYLDVGQGDAQLAALAGGVKILTDAGPDGRTRRELAEVLPGRRYLDLVILTHAELDHFGGLAEILKDYRVGAIIWNGRPPERESEEWRDAWAEIRMRGIPLVTLAQGDRIRIGENSIEFLAPNEALRQSGEMNDSSLVYVLRTPTARALFTGDSGFPTERMIVETDISAEILKVGHHGSRFSSDAEFLRNVAPRLTVIQAGAGNRYGHPAPEVLSRIAENTPAEIFRTDRHGTIEVELGQDRLRVFTEK
jgi:competence protein ComEC